MQPTKNYKWELLAVLWLAYFINQADRQIFSIVMPLIKADLNLKDSDLGLIASILVWTFGLLVPVAGFLGDRLSRKHIIGSSLLFWSIATFFTGYCNTVIQFVFLRGIATGGGEAFYAPAANALISDEHQKKQAFALSIHQTAVYFGIILSGLITAYIATNYGWRMAFYVFGVLGIIVSIIVFLRFKKDVPVQNNEPMQFKPALSVFKKPTVVLLTIAFGCMVFVNVGYLTWMPSLLAEKFSLTLVEAGFNSMFYHHVGAFFGVMIGGFLADKYAILFGGNRLLIQAIALLMAAPFIYWIGMAPSTFQTYFALFCFGIFRGVYDSNIYASLYEVVAPKIRASVSGLMLMFAFLTGAFSPFLLGLLKPIMGLAVGFSWLWVSYVIGAVCLLVALRVYFKKDAFILPKTSIKYV
ncbi:MAG: MFS transporter [Pedobacter sp.]|nr:MAG: MFS transporter [Pedobacter sp.]